jgi:hypothetical protein
MKKETINDEVTNDLVNYFKIQFKEYEIIVLDSLGFNLSPRSAIEQIKFLK